MNTRHPPRSRRPSPSRMRKNAEFSARQYIVGQEVVAGGGGGDARSGPPAERNVQLHIGGATSTQGSSVAGHPRDGGRGPEGIVMALRRGLRQQRAAVDSAGEASARAAVADAVHGAQRAAVDGAARL